MSWLFSQALVAEYSEASCSDGGASAPLNVISTPHPFWHRDKTTEFSRLSQFGLTWEALTVDHGEALLTSFRAAFPARTSAPREKAQESAENAPDSGPRWRGLSVTFDRDMCSWKTHHCLFPEALEWSSLTLPKWGMMRDGELWERITSVPLTSETESGLWPTPCAMEPEKNLKRFAHTRALPRSERGGGKGPNLATAVKLWPTPTSSMMTMGDMIQAQYSVNDPKRPKYLPTPTASDGTGWNKRTAQERKAKGQQVRLCNALSTEETRVGGSLNPPWVEWLMGWAIGWTDLEPLEMDKFQQWRQRHGESLAEKFE